MPKGHYTRKPKADVQTKVVEVLKEVFIEVEKPRLEDYDLYKALKDTGYPQGGNGQYIDETNGIERVYVPTAPEVVSFFAGDPDKWELMRDGIIRTYLEIYESY